MSILDNNLSHTSILLPFTNVCQPCLWISSTNHHLRVQCNSKTNPLFLLHNQVNSMSKSLELDYNDLLLYDWEFNAIFFKSSSILTIFNIFSYNYLYFKKIEFAHKLMGWTQMVMVHKNLPKIITNIQTWRYLNWYTVIIFKLMLIFGTWTRSNSINNFWLTA